MPNRLAVSRCCCEEPSCLIVTDTFERADSADIDAGSPCGWTEQSGSTLAITSNEVSGAGTAVCNRVKSSHVDQLRITGSLRFTSSTGNLRIIYHWTDANNYNCAEFTHTSTDVYVKVITRKAGTESTQGTSTLSHSLDTDELYDFCVSFDSALATWVIKATLALQASSEFFVPLQVAFTGSGAAAETGSSAFKQNSTASLSEWTLSKLQAELSGCPDCMNCTIAELSDDFSASQIAAVPAPPENSGRWEQRNGAVDLFTIVDGELTTETGGNLYHCWIKQSFADFAVVAQVTLTSVTTYGNLGTFGMWLAYSTTYKLGFSSIPVPFFPVGDWYWRTVYENNSGTGDASETYTTGTQVQSGDVLKITATRKATAGYWDVIWYVNASAVRTKSNLYIGSGFDDFSPDNILIRSSYESVWDDFYFTSNATLD